MQSRSPSIAHKHGSRATSALCQLYTADRGYRLLSGVFINRRGVWASHRMQSASINLTRARSRALSLRIREPRTSVTVTELECIVQLPWQPCCNHLYESYEHLLYRGNDDNMSVVIDTH